MIWLWVVLAFLSGAIPYSVLIGRWIGGIDIREYGDKNPGATNVLRATGSKFWFVVAVSLDISKGLVPLFWAKWGFQIGGLELALVGIAAIAGHAFSPFLNFNGGKAIATTAGVWFGIMLLEAMLVQPILLVFFFYLVDSSDWAVIGAMLAFLGYLLAMHGGDSALLGLWGLNFLLLLYKHRDGLGHLPRLRWRKKNGTP